MKLFLSLVLVTIIGLLLLLINDYIYVSSGEPKDYWSDGIFDIYFFILMGIGYFVATLIIKRDWDIRNRLFLSLILASISSINFFFGAFYIVLYFHVYIGGSL